MKIIAQLPEAKHYRRVESPAGKIIFRDKATPLFEIESPIANPWDKQWLIVIGIKKGANPQVTVAGKIRFKLLKPTANKDIQVARIERTFAYGKFDYPPRDSRYHVGFPVSIINQEQVDNGEIPTYKWLQYDLFDMEIELQP